MARKQRLLIVEDEEAIRTGLIDVFVYHGYDVNAESDGKRGLERALGGGFDLVLLDVMLPSMNGFDICDAIRKQDREQPVIMLTAKVSDEDIVNGLKLGADDYIGKPFGIQELVLRVEAVLRRSDRAGADERELDLGDGLIVDSRGALRIARRRRRRVHAPRDRAAESPVPASRTGPVSRAELLNAVWGYAKHLDIETRTVDIHVAKLRRKIERDPKQPERLVTVRGAGYRLVVG